MYGERFREVGASKTGAEKGLVFRSLGTDMASSIHQNCASSEACLLTVQSAKCNLVQIADTTYTFQETGAAVSPSLAAKNR